jgi:hypothetical protein
MDTALKHWRLHGWLGARAAQALQSWMSPLVYRTVIRANVDVERAIEHLRPILQERTQVLCDLLGRTFPIWTTLYGDAAPRSAGAVARSRTGATDVGRCAENPTESGVLGTSGRPAPAVK